MRGMKPSANFAKGRDTKQLNIADYRRIAENYGLQPAHVQAVVRVEAGNSGFWNDSNMKLLYEGHIAYKETSGALRTKLVKANLAWKNWGAVPYGKASVSRDRLRKAIEIAGDEAYRWASYGLGQTMGFNAEICGYKSAKEMFEAYLVGEPSQLDGMMRFIKGNGLLDKLKRRDWHGFARGYNGPGYAKNNYHNRLAQAYAEFSAGKPQISVTIADPWADGIVTIGDKGPVVEEIQRIVGATVDGHFGRATAQAVEAWQKRQGLIADGIVGQKTYAAMNALRHAPTEAEKPVNPAPMIVGVGVSGGLLYAVFELVRTIFGV